jgi:hypothetical protein
VEDPLGSFAAEREVTRVLVAHEERVIQPSILTRQPSTPTRPFPLVSLLLVVLAAAGWGAFFYERARPIERDTPVASEPRGSSDAAVSAISRDTPGSFDTPPPAAPAPSVDQPKPVPPIVAEEPPASTAPPARDSPTDGRRGAEAPGSEENIATSGSVPNVAGSWALSTQAESSSYVPSMAPQVAFELRLQQQGDRVTGVGRKVAENSNAIGSVAQTPMTLNGTIAGQRLTLSFLEPGAERATQGKFVLLMQEDGTMRGRFSSTAAQSSGRVEARRVSR